MNAVLIILDTLRKDHVGCYGNKWIRTPNLDSLAKEGVIFTNAYPESLPTLPARRAIFTGTRIYPPSNYAPQKGDFVGAPGWGPISEEKDTLAELLQQAGYHTAFITDTYHYFKPSKNFHRGFDEWIWIRGQEADPYVSRWIIPEKDVLQYLPECLRGNKRYVRSYRQYLANVSNRRCEEDYFAPQVFRSAMDWVETNYRFGDFFLLIDSFDPHEPWDPPIKYRRLYDDSELDSTMLDVILSNYGNASLLSEREIRRLRANYAGEVTMVDRWVGNFIDELDALGILDNTLVIIVSDHGHCIGEHGLISKQGYPMTREIADLVFIVRHPEANDRAIRRSEFVYHHDIFPTILASMGVFLKHEPDGVDLNPLILNKGDSPVSRRDHVTTGWGPFVMVRDSHYWYNAFVWGDDPLLYNLDTDPSLSNNLADKKTALCEKYKNIALNDIGGSFPAYLREMAEAREPGCTPVGCWK